VPVLNFFGIEDQNFRGGARVAFADVNGDGFLDLVVAAGFQGGPRIALFDGSDLLAAGQQGRAPQKLVGDFFAFEENLRNGAFVAGGDIDGDGMAEVIFGGGPGGAPRVLIARGADLIANPVAAVTAPLANFFAGNADLRGGIRVTTADLDGDQRADLVTGSGDRLPLNTLTDVNGDGVFEAPDVSLLPPSEVITYLGVNLLNADGEPARQQAFQPFGSLGLVGVYVG
jgi:hypothetical protein